MWIFFFSVPRTQQGNLLDFPPTDEIRPWPELVGPLATMATQALRVPLGANWTFFVLPIIGPPLTQMSPSAYFQKSTNLHSCFLHVAVLGCSAVESNRRNIDLVLAPFCCISRSLFHCFAVSADRFGFTSFGSVLKPGRYLGCHLAQRVQPFLHIFLQN